MNVYGMNEWFVLPLSFCNYSVQQVPNNIHYHFTIMLMRGLRDLTLVYITDLWWNGFVVSFHHSSKNLLRRMLSRVSLIIVNFFLHNSWSSVQSYLIFFFRFILWDLRTSWKFIFEYILHFMLNFFLIERLSWWL